MTHSIPTRPCRPGFTLIELLAVLGMIAVLAALLFPVFTHARHQSRMRVCASNLHQISLALNLYEQDCNGLPPNKLSFSFPDDQVVVSQSVWTSLQPYLVSPDVLRCPESNGRDSYGYRAGPNTLLNLTHPAPHLLDNTVLVYCVAHVQGYPLIDFREHLIDFREHFGTNKNFTGQFLVVRGDGAVSQVDGSRVQVWEYYEGGQWYPPGSTPPTRAEWQNVSRVLRFPNGTWPPPDYPTTN